MNGKYYSYVRHNEKNDSRAEPWTDEMRSDAVVFSFRALKKNGCLLALVQKLLLCDGVGQRHEEVNERRKVVGRGAESASRSKAAGDTSSCARRN